MITICGLIVLTCFAILTSPCWGCLIALMISGSICCAIILACFTIITSPCWATIMLMVAYEKKRGYLKRNNF